MTPLNDIRRVELSLAATHLPAGGRVLEIGSGSGYQAHLLELRGHSVVALDLPTRPAPAIEYHPVATFDGRNIPLEDDSFDAVFSSNVLEHVEDLSPLLEETRRVLKAGGVAVHTMPTPVWRFWTSLTHYPEMGRRARAQSQHRARSSTSTAADEAQAPSAASPRSRLRRYLLPGPHGVSRSALAELVAFQEGRWRHALERCGFVVTEAHGCGLFYTGHLLVADLPIEPRRRLARVLGSSCRLYVTRPL